MPKKPLPIFATQGDLVALLQEVCCVRPLDLAVMGLFDQGEPAVLTDPKGLQPFTAYLVCDKGLGVAVRLVSQRNGGVKYAVDQLENPHTVALSCGGLVDGRRLIAGQMGTSAAGERAEEIYAILAKAIRRRFEKIKSYYVGPEAAQLLDQGLRLTPTAKSPETYDLIRTCDKSKGPGSN